MVEPNLKEAVKAMCKAYPGGREAMAGALGMTLTQFNNNLYEKNGCRFFEVSELEAMEDMKLKKSWCITAATWLRVKKRSRQLSRCLHAKRSDASELQLLASWRVVISGDY